MFKEVEKN